MALVGETGAGKTTVARLLARFYDPDEGRVLLDGVDLRDLPDDELRARDRADHPGGFLFEGTVAENIRLGGPPRAEAEVEAAARAIGATSSSPRCRTATTPRSASAAGGCRPGSAS